ALLCRLAVDAHLSCRQAAANPVFAAYQLLRRRLHPGAGRPPPGDRLLPGQPDERRGGTGGGEKETDVWGGRKGGEGMKIVVKIRGAALRQAARLPAPAPAVQ